MLWKKESSKGNALYMNILGLSAQNLMTIYENTCAYEQNTKPIPHKDDALALEKRMEGNSFFFKNAYGPAIEIYNESLCLARPGSQHISLAYANRASCFLHLKMYKECLRDIELAEAAGCPERLLSKLNQRKENCLKRMKEDVNAVNNVTIDAKLSFEPDNMFPCMANVLTVQKNDKGKYGVFAKEDIDVDQTIVVEQCYRPYLLKRHGLKCNICLRGYTNLVPCNKCTMAMFCEGCQHHFLHKLECGVNMCGPSAFNSDVLLAVRGILMAINLFPTINGLMKFVEDLIRNDPKALPQSLADDQSKYQAFFAKAEGKPSLEDLALTIYPVYKTILFIPKIKAKFQTEKHLRLLQHLIGHHSMINASFALFGSCKKQTIDEEWADSMMYCNHVDLFDQYFRYSCEPNVLSIVGDGKLVSVVVRPIKQGEQLFIPYVPFDIEPTKHRQEYLAERTNWICKCPRCNGVTATYAQRDLMKMDPSYLYIVSNYLCAMFALSTTIESSSFIRDMIEHCIAFLRKFGRMDWCGELQGVLSMYQTMLHTRVAGKTTSV